ncbi:peptidoglycan DD-metalloendopeptidase family protein [Metabacillus sp. GX 13764]|uniref:M23 family metallopeptidase n=1 Tax=Metabacillus kandeliae TaxID=2900151 RepID=UPI001E58A442|nr:M23 family metallopeptidase [Metabacillus kandeliae]MCD7035311.1 peptidoglycan DD-metalloendopeptidase family protein [Metabacillus kandeliae]
MDYGSKHNGYKSRSSFWKRSLTGSVCAAALLFGTSGASADSELPEVYHIYINGKNAGTVDDKSIIEKVSEEAIQKEQPKFKDMPLMISNLKVVPEQVFRPAADNEKTAERMKKEMTVAIESTAIFADGKPAAFFKSKKEAEEALKQYQLKYTSERKLREYKKLQDGEKLPPLKEGQSRITKLELTNGVHIGEVKAAPNAITNVKDGLKKLEKGTVRESLYKVQEDDTKSGIASSYSMSTDELKKLNPGLKEDGSLEAGSKVKVLVNQPYFDVVIQEDVSKQEALPFQTETVKDASMEKGKTIVKQKGEDGQAQRSYVFKIENGRLISREIVSDHQVKEPVKEIVMKGTKKVSSVGDGSLEWPAMGGVITSKLGTRWGKLHKGIDISGVSNKTIKAADGGKVIFAGKSNGYGNKVEIDHGNGFKTLYGHLNSISVSEGETVEKGEKIGVMGSTGHSTGLHLHFEVYKNGKLKNPLNYVNK